MMMRPPGEVPEYRETARKRANEKVTQSKMKLCDNDENETDELFIWE